MPKRTAKQPKRLAIDRIVRREWKGFPASCWYCHGAEDACECMCDTHRPYLKSLIQRIAAECAEIADGESFPPVTDKYEGAVAAAEAIRREFGIEEPDAR